MGVISSLGGHVAQTECGEFGSRAILAKNCCSSELVTIMILSISVEMGYLETAVQVEILLDMNPLAEVSVGFRYDGGVI